MDPSGTLPTRRMTFGSEVALGLNAERPAWAKDAPTDPDLARFIAGLMAATWGDWQLVHHRVAAIPRPINIYEELRQSVGDEDATAGAEYANSAAVVVNRLVLEQFVRHANETADLRLAKTWLELLDLHDGPPTGALFQAVWAIVLRRGLSTAARAQSGQPYARCVDPAPSDLEPGE